METDKDILLAQMNNARAIEVARISAAKQPADTGSESQEELVATGIQHAQENFTAEQDRRHEVAQTLLEHHLDSAQSAQEHQQQMQQGQQQAQTQAALADQSHQQQMAQGQQAADLAPQPDTTAQ